MSAAPAVYVVDDDPGSRRATGHLLRAAGFGVHLHDGGAALLAALPADAAGCVVMDLDMPGMDGLAVQAALAEAGQRMPVVFLTGRGDIPSSVRAMRAGAEDFLEKTASPDLLLAAVRRALARDAEARAGRAGQAAARARLARLSAREQEVLAQLVQGVRNKQIAGALGIGERTVKLHRSAITAKLQVRSLAELLDLVRLADAPPPGAFPKGN
ncbi:MAG: response regulator transcription factor [Chromatiales bacterium]|jgi:FixJ family two-component response regulator|nr:response regulator transcription factor [Chromatiales bacterium]